MKSWQACYCSFLIVIIHNLNSFCVSVIMSSPFDRKIYDITGDVHLRVQVDTLITYWWSQLLDELISWLVYEWYWFCIDFLYVTVRSHALVITNSSSWRQPLIFSAPATRPWVPFWTFVIRQAVLFTNDLVAYWWRPRNMKIIVS